MALMSELHTGEKLVGKHSDDRLLQRKLSDWREGTWVIKMENCMEEEKASQMVFNLSCLYWRHCALRLQELLLPLDSAEVGFPKSPVVVKALGPSPPLFPWLHWITMMICRTGQAQTKITMNYNGFVIE